MDQLVFKTDTLTSKIVDPDGTRVEKAKTGPLTISIAEGLQTLLRHGFTGGPIEYPLDRRASIKDIVESLGIPHTEIGSLRAADQAVDFEYIPEPGQALQVRAVSAPWDVTRPTRLRPAPLPAVRFIVDVNVGRLAALLRLSGFDAVYEKEMDDRQIADIAHREHRIVLSKDRALLKRRKIVFGRLVRAILPHDQLTETLRFFGLTGRLRLFSRCMVCNGILETVAKETILHRLEPKTKKYFNRFKMCPDCRRIFWQGSHCTALKKKLHRAGLLTPEKDL